jgi:uncharacterized delta-60 repeat protein
MVLVSALLAIPAGASAADSMALQPDGKIVVAGEAWPGFGMAARLNPDGSRDRSFGDEGVVIDRRLNSLRVVAVQPDGRILASSGRRLGRYLVDGSPDLSFGENGIAGEGSPLPYLNRQGAEGPESILLRPDGQFFLAGPRNLSYPTSQGIVRLFSASGGLVETVGFIPEPGSGRSSESVVKDLAIEPDGSTVGAGWAYSSDLGTSAVLARFVPGSATAYDPTFGNGQGLVRVRSSTAAPSGASAIVRDGGSLVIAGTTSRTFMLGRFSADGIRDPSFGEEGIAAPTIDGTSGGAGQSEAQAVAVDSAGRLVAAGGTTKWGSFQAMKGGGEPVCQKCLEPLVVRFTADGRLDPSFGAGGAARVIASGGAPLQGEAEDVAMLADGKILVKGSRRIAGTTLKPPFLARLNPDGSLDRSFGDEGVARVQVACLAKNLERLRKRHCIPSARVHFRVGKLAGDHPTLSLRIEPSLPWARIAMVRLQLPPALRASLGAPKKSRIVALGGTKGTEAGGVKRYLGVEPVELEPGRVAFRELGEPQALHVELRPGALVRKSGRADRLSAQKLTFRVTVRFLYEGARAGRQTRVFRVTG